MMFKTLVVEDDPMVSSINKNYLEKIESMLWVGSAKNGQEALGLIQTHSPELILMDIYMPSLNGMELLREIRRREIQTDLILITAADHPQVIQESLRLGVVDYLIKPFDFARFRTAVELFKKRYLMFLNHASLNQQLLDSLNTKLIDLDVKENSLDTLPKGIDPITLQVIQDTLKCSQHPLSAQDIADQIQLSRITTRKYLEFLCEVGEIALDLKYSAKGRPTKLYTYHSNF